MAVITDPKNPLKHTLDIRNGKNGPRRYLPFQGTREEAETCYEELTAHRTGKLASSAQLRTLYGRFVAWYGLEHAPGTVADFRQAWKRLNPFFGSMGFRTIESRIDDYKAMRRATKYLPGKPDQKPEADTPAESLRRKQVSKRTITRELAYLSTFCKWAKDKNFTTVIVHIHGFPRKQTKAAIQQTHTFKEVQSIIEHSAESRHNGADRHGLTLLMYDAGLRRTEACRISAERVELLSGGVSLGKNSGVYYGSITVTRKGGKEQRLPILTERLWLELKGRKEKTKHGFLYINPTTERPYVDLRDGLKSAAKRAKVDKRVTHHLFRHDFVTHLHEGGADLKTIQELVGHADIQTTLNIYEHLDHATMIDRAGGFAKKVNAHGKAKKGGGRKSP